MFDLNTSSSEVAGNGRISEAHVVEGGKFVAFVSTSSNLVAGDTNGVADVFLKHLETGAVTRVSTSASGGQANAASAGLDVSPDGTKLIFHSKADNLVAGDANGFSDVFVKDIATGAVSLVSTSASRAAGNGDSTDGAFSPDGRSIAFRSTAANLVPNDLNGALDVFLKDLGTGTVKPLSFLDDGSFLSVPVMGKPVFSPDGKTVSFGTYSYALDSTGLLVLDVSFPRSQTGNFTATVSKGDGSPAKTYAGNGITATVGLDYDRDGDFQAAVNGQSFTVKVRAHSGAQNFTGAGTSETVLLSSGNDKADGGGGNDTLVGGDGQDDLGGGGGNDILDGGRGADTLRGGIGDDRYCVDEVGDTVVEAAGAGRDTVVASVSTTLGANVENLVLTGTASLTGTGNGLANVITGTVGSNVLSGLDGDDTLNGGAGSDILDGGVGDDILDGGTGLDRMIGGSGDDLYVLDAAGDRVEEQSNGGIDTISASFNITLAANVENLILREVSVDYYMAIDGIGNDSDNRMVGNAIDNRLTGFGGSDVLIGNGGNDTLDGGTGTNRMAGGTGNDTYYVSSSSDQVVEALGEGNSDTIYTSGDFTLSTGVEVERLYLATSSSRVAVKLTGNEFRNQLQGGSRDDVLDGGAGADQLTGGGGNDTYYVDDAGDAIVERARAGSDTVVTSVSYTLGAGDFIETFRFRDGRSSVSLDLIGNEVGQTLIGNGGASRLIGRGGDDTYIVDGSDDRVFEAGAEGNDTVVTRGSYTLEVGQEIETLRLADAAGTAARNLTGNGFANALIGNAGNNILDGAGGADSLTGGAGNDTYRVDDAGDRVFEKAGEGSDTIRTSVSYGLAAGQSVETLALAAGTTALDLTGNELANTLRDNAGDNRLDGGAGRDTLISSGGRDVLIGGQGSDSAIIDRSGATASLRFVMTSVDGTTTLVGDGTTTTSIGNITLTGGSGRDTFTTLEGVDTLNGGAGNDTLNGGAGADRLRGGTGDDTFVVDNAGDRVFEAAGGGHDTVFAATSYTLAAGQEIEALQLLASTGGAGLNLTGNAFAQSLVGNNGVNVLNGGGGADVLTGRGGGDTYIVDNAGDRVVEAAGGGRDTVLASTRYALAAGQEIEALQLLASTGSADLDLSGNAFAQSLVGNNGANVLEARGGADVLTGRGGADSFVFSTSLGAGNVDRITDFAAEDTVRLSGSVFSALAPGQLTESAFKNISTGSADASDRILYKQATGELFYDADGSGSGAAVKFAVLDNKAALTHADFLVV